MIRFVQAADANYAPAGLALYLSLVRHQPGDWRMTWVVLDEVLEARLALWALRWPDVARRLDVVAAAVVGREMGGLATALAGRQGREWYWSWGAQVTAWAIEREPGATVVYLDTDTFVFADLTPALDELVGAGADVGLVSHRFPPARSGMWKRATYCTGTLTTFRPGYRARACAAWWAAMVRARCLVDDPGDGYLGIPPGRAGDQAPLDAFPRMARIHEITEPGTGIAPYNWSACGVGDGPTARNAWAPSADGHGSYVSRDRPAPIRLVHFHEHRFSPIGALLRRTAYDIPEDVGKTLVAPYEAAVLRAGADLAASGTEQGTR